MKIPTGYKYHGSFRFKNDAVTEKDRIKKQGLLARVIKNSRRWDIGSYTYYDVYVARKSSPKRASKSKKK